MKGRIKMKYVIFCEENFNFYYTKINQYEENLLKHSKDGDIYRIVLTENEAIEICDESNSLWRI